MKQMWSKEELEKLPKDISTLIDSAGNPRFIEGEGEPATIEGFTATYSKWSLSGTHLMFVLAGTLADTTALLPNVAACSFTIPDFIYNKIVGVVGNTIEYKQITAYAANYTGQNVIFRTAKDANNKFVILFGNTITMTADRSFRAQFDLLIDSE